MVQACETYDPVRESDGPGSTMGGDDIRRRLDQLDQNALPAQRKFIVALRVNKGYVETGSAFTNAAGSKAHAFSRQIFDGFSPDRRPTIQCGSAAEYALSGSSQGRWVA